MNIEYFPIAHSLMSIIRFDSMLDYWIRKVLTEKRYTCTLPYLPFESLVPHIKFSGCKIDVCVVEFWS